MVCILVMGNFKRKFALMMVISGMKSSMDMEFKIIGIKTNIRAIFIKENLMVRDNCKLMVTNIKDFL